MQYMVGVLGSKMVETHPIIKPSLMCMQARLSSEEWEEIDHHTNDGAVQFLPVPYINVIGISPTPGELSSIKYIDPKDYLCPYHQ